MRRISKGDKNQFLKEKKQKNIKFFFNQLKQRFNTICAISFKHYAVLNFSLHPHIHFEHQFTNPSAGQNAFPTPSLLTIKFCFFNFKLILQEF